MLLIMYWIALPCLFLACLGHGRHVQVGKSQRFVDADKNMIFKVRKHSPLKVLASMMMGSSLPETAFISTGVARGGVRSSIADQRVFQARSTAGDDIAAKLQDPQAEREDEAKRQKQDKFKVNVGEALDRLTTDIPEILRRDPNWDIYTEDLELDLELRDPAATRWLGAATPASRTKVRGLRENRRVLKELQQFCHRLVQWHELKAKPRVAIDPSTGDQIIEVRWSSRIGMKPMTIPRWATAIAGIAAVAAATTSAVAQGEPLFALNVLADDSLLSEAALLSTSAATTAAAGQFLKERFPSLGFPFATAAMRESPYSKVLVIDAVSRFHLNAEGRIHKHVINNVNINMIEDPIRFVPPVNQLLQMAGLRQAYPELARV